jgi:hypothetical protein
MRLQIILGYFLMTSSVGVPLAKYLIKVKNEDIYHLISFSDRWRSTTSRELKAAD